MEYSELKFALYARKSTEDKKKQVQSIPDQVRLMKERAKSLDINIRTRAVFTEEKSAKTPGKRPEFTRMVADIQEGKYNAIICWQLNRLARNPQESGILQQMLQDGQIKCILTNDKTYLPSDNAVLFSVESGISNQFIRDLMVNVRRGMHSKAEKGWMPGVPACGYLNDRETKTIVIDDERFALVRQMWDYFLTGTYTVPQIARMADKDWGLRTKVRGERGGKPLSTSGVYAMLQNPFYMGYLRYGGKLIKGLHTAMISPEEFDTAQSLINKRNNPRPEVNATEKDPFPYRGLIKCGECGCSITYTKRIKKQLNGNVHSYEYCYCTRRRTDYLCTQRMNISPQDMTVRIREEISKYTIMDEFFQWACKYLDKFNESEIAAQEQVYASQVKTIATLETEIRELGRLRYRGQIDDAFYEGEKQELENRLVTLRGKFNDQEENNKRHRRLLDKYFNFARYAQEDFEGDEDLKKKEVLSIIGQNLLFKDGELEFEPIKYLIPIVEKYPALKTEYDSVGTLPEQMKKEALASIISAWCTIQHQDYPDLIDHLEAGDLVVLNNTRVIKARLKAVNSNNQPRELLLLESHHNESPKRRQIIYRGKLQAGETLYIAGEIIKIEQILSGGMAVISSSTNLLEVAVKHGSVPLPPYLRRAAEKSDAERYQTEFATASGSIAAPTASLNFTNELAAKLTAKGVHITYLTLHVGLGTFLPIRSDSVEEHIMHSEYFEVPIKTVTAIQKAKAAGKKIIAVGTTVTRTLEYTAEQILASSAQALSGEANIFIYPGYQFKVVDKLLTNFHAPRSTVLMMAAAFSGWDNLKHAYEEALTYDYKFLSYGDSMLIE